MSFRWIDHKYNVIELIHPLGEICDNPRFVFNIVIITYIPALKLDLFPWKTHCVQIHGTTNIVRWIHLNCARVNYLDLQSNVASVRWSWVQVVNFSGWSASGITATRVKSPGWWALWATGAWSVCTMYTEALHFSRFKPLCSELHKSGYKSHILFYEMPILCWNPSLWCPSTHLWRTKLTSS